MFIDTIPPVSIEEHLSVIILTRTLNRQVSVRPGYVDFRSKVFHLGVVMPSQDLGGVLTAVRGRSPETGTVLGLLFSEISSDCLLLLKTPQY